MKKKIIIAIIIILVIFILIGIYIGINYKKIFLSGRTVTLTGRFELPEATKACIAFLYTGDYGRVEIWPNFLEVVEEKYGEEKCALQKYFNGKNVKIKGKLEYVVCKELSQCYPGEFWAFESIDSIEIIDEKQLIEETKEKYQQLVSDPKAKYCEIDEDCDIAWPPTECCPCPEVFNKEYAEEIKKLLLLCIPPEVVCKECLYDQVCLERECIKCVNNACKIVFPTRIE